MSAVKRSPPLQRYDLKGHLAFVAYLHHLVERFHETDHMHDLVIPGATKVARIATEKNNPFTKFGDTCTRSAGQRKLADVLNVIENNAPTQ